MKPLVTVIGIAYNHAPFIKEALESLWAQSYPAIEVILMDDGSRDDSQSIIRELLADREKVHFIAHAENQGYTQTFNEGLAMAKGDYIIDFGLDDVMLPDFISKSVAALEKAGEPHGVVFSNAEYIDAQSEVIGNHTETLLQKGMIKTVPEGDIFTMVLRRYFICTPTMVMKRSVLDRLGGYDPDLAYEDFDFWVRSSRFCHYRYQDEVLMKKRKLSTSMSANRLQHRQNEQLKSVYHVCEKAFALCKTKTELSALRERLAYEYRQCLRTDHSALAEKYALLYRQAGGFTLRLQLTRLAMKVGVDPRRV